MNIQKLFQKTLFGIFLLFGLIGVSTSILCIYTVDTHLSKEYENNSKGIAKTIADSSVDIILNRDLSVLQSLIDQFVECRVAVASEIEDFISTMLQIEVVLDIGQAVPTANISVVLIAAFQFQPFRPFRRINGRANTNGSQLRLQYLRLPYRILISRRGHQFHFEAIGVSGFSQQCACFVQILRIWRVIEMPRTADINRPAM